MKKVEVEAELDIFGLVGFVVLFMSIGALVAVGVLSSIGQSDRNLLKQYKHKIIQCEKELPTSQRCELSAIHLGGAE